MNIYIAKKNNLNNINNRLYESSLGQELLKMAYRDKLGKELNLSHIKRDENNKPYIINNDVYFNISHSRDFVVCVIADFEIGIDIEQDRKLNENAIKKFALKEDFEICENAIKIWNIKEAYSKYLGIGLKLDFSSVSIFDINNSSSVLVDEICEEISNYENIYLAVCFSNNINFDFYKNFKYVWKSL